MSDLAGAWLQIDGGVDGVTVNLPANGHVPGRVALLGETLAPVVNRS